jgi:hypothetical protein
MQAYYLFLATPGDVGTERDYVREIIENKNCVVFRPRGYELILKEWRADTFPDHGTDPQDIVNEQIANMKTFDLFVGIMWNRLGTPTPRAESGTVEEFERAAEASTQTGKPKIWLYFRDAKAELTTDEQLEQRKKVLAFRKRVEADGLRYRYKTIAAFKKIFGDHLQLWFNQLEDRRKYETQPFPAISLLRQRFENAKTSGDLVPLLREAHLLLDCESLEHRPAVNELIDRIQARLRQTPEGADSINEVGREQRPFLWRPTLNIL